MRTVNHFLRVFLLVPVILLGGVSRVYYLAQIAGRPLCSGTLKYVAFCSETNTPAVLSPRSDLNKQLSIHLKRVLIIHHSVYARIVEKELAPALTHDGMLPSVSETQLKSHSLFSLRCLLTV